MINNTWALHQVMGDVHLSRRGLNGVIHKRLKKVLVSAYRHVPYYREMMSHVKYDPEKDFSGADDLSVLPITTKSIVKKKGPKAFCRIHSDLSRYFSDRSSGSTGITVTVYRSSYERALQIAKWLRVLFLNGYSISDSVMGLVGTEKLNEGRSIIQHFGILRRNAVDYMLPVEKIVDILLDLKPDVLYGNRSHLDLVALELRRRGASAKGLKLVVETGEIIHGSSRTLCRERFGVELIESYGSVEMGVMAYETGAHDGLHLCEDLTYFEFLDEKGKPVAPGEPGRVVVTDLSGKLMPFIRYDHGDRATFQIVKDERGNSIRRITRIFGRDDDYAILPDGTRRPFHDFAVVLNRYQGIFQYQIVQKEKNRFQIHICADAAYMESIRNDVLRRLEDQFPPSVIFDISRVDRISPDRSGKIRKLISEIQPAD